MQAIIDDRYFKNTQIISPGNVGSVGDVLASVRLKQSTPDMALRYDGMFSGKRESAYGSNVQDGDSKSYTSGGGAPRLLDSRWTRNTFKTNHGWRFQDIRVPDKNLEPVMGSTGQADWYNRVANIYQARVTGDAFLPLPGEYGPTSMVRGSQIPRIIAVDKPTLPDLSDQKEQNIVKDKTVVGRLCYDSQGRPFIRSGRPTPPGQSQIAGRTAPPSTQPPPPVQGSTAPPSTLPASGTTNPEEDLSNLRFSF